MDITHAEVAQAELRLRLEEIELSRTKIAYDMKAYVNKDK
jgi:multidrug resistance efflux pump